VTYFNSLSHHSVEESKENRMNLSHDGQPRTQVEADVPKYEPLQLPTTIAFELNAILN
jgi:hypothetical protein